MSDNIFEKLKRSDFSPATVREIIQSAYAEKISRIFLEDEQLHYLAPVLDELGLDYFLSPKKYILIKMLAREVFPTVSENWFRLLLQTEHSWSILEKGKKNYYMLVNLI